jgi:uncharacterized protein
MSAEENKQRAKDGYEAFGRGDAEAAMKDMDDGVEWVLGGDNVLTGTHKGKEAVGQVWAQVGAKGFQSEPKKFLAEDDKVVVLRSNTIDGEQGDGADVLSYSAEGLLIRFETYGNEAAFDRAFPK